MAHDVDFYCPNCHRRNTAGGYVGSEDAPAKNGDIGICVECSGLFVIVKVGDITDARRMESADLDALDLGTLANLLVAKRVIVKRLREMAQ